MARKLTLYKGPEFSYVNQNKQTKTKVYTMKLINTLALIAATMALSTEAIKLKDEANWQIDEGDKVEDNEVNEADLAEQFVSLIFKAGDKNEDEVMDREEFLGLLDEVTEVYNAASEADGDGQNGVSQDEIIHEIKLKECLASCYEHGGCPCDK